MKNRHHNFKVNIAAANIHVCFKIRGKNLNSICIRFHNYEFTIAHPFPDIHIIYACIRKILNNARLPPEKGCCLYRHWL